MPSFARNHVSTSPVDDWASIISMFDQPIRASIGTIGASSITSRREWAAGIVDAAAWGGIVFIGVFNG